MPWPERILLVTVGDPADPTSCSGMPSNMAAAMRRACAGVTVIGFDNLVSRRGLVRRTLRRLGSLGARAESHLFSFDGSLKPLERWVDRAGAIAARRCASAASTEIASIVRDIRPDLVVGAVMPWPLLSIPSHVPLVYFTDVVTPLANQGYPSFASRSRSYKAEADRLERSLWARVDAAIFPASNIRAAAVECGLRPERASIAFMGANVLGGGPAPKPAPSRDDLRILIVASDPVRKRTDFALDTCEQLRRLGWNVTAELIGRPTPKAESLPFVVCRGSLRLGAPDDAAVHQRALSAAHVLLLPSLAEGAPIAPCEAAHCAVPAVTSDAGGLPDVVVNGITGRVLSVHATSTEYATAVLDVVANPDVYRTISAAALTRARDLFTWDHWAATVLSAARSLTNRSPAIGRAPSPLPS